MNKKILFGRISLFIIYFWFGILKVVGESAANPLVESLQQKTLPFIPFATFIVLFGLFEMLIGILFLIPNLTVTKITKWIFAFHMVTTTMPLFLLPDMGWSGFLVPTLEGQYIIKNLVLIATVLFI